MAKYVSVGNQKNVKTGNIFSVQALLMMPFMEYYNPIMKEILQEDFPMSSFFIRGFMGSVFTQARNTPVPTTKANNFLKRLYKIPFSELYKEQLVLDDSSFETKMKNYEEMWVSGDYTTLSHDGAPFKSNTYNLNRSREFFTWLSTTELGDPVYQRFLSPNFSEFKTARDLTIDVATHLPEIPEIYYRNFLNQQGKLDQYLQYGNINKAEEMVRKNIQIDPLVLNDWLTLYAISMIKRNIVEAKKFLRMALVCDHITPIVWGLIMNLPDKRMNIHRR